MVLEDYATWIGSAAGVATFGLALAPAFICWAIIKKGSTKDIPIDSFIESIARNVMNLQQGTLIAAWPMVISNLIGFFLNISYISIYVLYTQDKSSLKRICGFWGSVMCAFIAYAQLEDKTVVEWRFGTLLAAFNIAILVYHVYRLRVVIQSKSTKNLPFPILVAASAVTFLWFLYGMALHKPMLMLQTGIAFMLCASSLSMFLIYPSSEAKTKTTDKKKTR